jgi:hypothetical protein
MIWSCETYITYLVFSKFTSRPTSVLASNRACTGLLYYQLRTVFYQSQTTFKSTSRIQAYLMGQFMLPVCRTYIRYSLMYPAQSNDRLWDGRPGFDSRQGKWRVYFSLRHRVQAGSGAHSGSYSVGTGSCFTGSKQTGAWRWPLTSL